MTHYPKNKCCITECHKNIHDCKQVEEIFDNNEAFFNAQVLMIMEAGRLLPLLNRPLIKFLTIFD